MPNKITEDRLKKLMSDFENPSTINIGGKSFLPETAIGAVSSAFDIGAGIYGMFKDENINAPTYESTYQESKLLPQLRDKAVADAFSGSGDDYAARIRSKNVYNDTVQSAVNRSAGSRAFVQSNVAAAGDVYNLANLQIDKELQAKKSQSLAVASNIENLVMQDKLNKLKDNQYANEDKFRKLMAEIGLDKENRAGATSLIKSGINNAAMAVNNESQWGKNGTMRSLMLSQIELEMVRAGVKTGNGSIDTGSNSDGSFSREGVVNGQSVQKTFNYKSAFDLIDGGNG